MNYWIYSHEAIPNPRMMGKRGYTPDGDYIRWGGITLPILPAKEWIELKEDDPRYTTLRRTDWRDKQGTQVDIPLRRFMPVVNGDGTNPSRFTDKGVVMLDHKPSPEEQKRLAEVCEENNFKFRKRCIEFFENQRDMAKARQGQYDPTPYIDECYDVCGLPKPYSMEAMKSQRQPGFEAADRIAGAIAGALKQDRKEREEAAMKVAEKIVAPEPFSYEKEAAAINKNIPAPRR